MLKLGICGITPIGASILDLSSPVRGRVGGSRQPTVLRCRERCCRARLGWRGRVSRSWRPRRLFTLHSRSVLGRIELALGNLEPSGVHLRYFPDGLRAVGLNDPALPLWANRSKR